MTAEAHSDGNVHVPPGSLATANWLLSEAYAQQRPAALTIGPEAVIPAITLDDNQITLQCTAPEQAASDLFQQGWDRMLEHQ